MLEIKDVMYYYKSQKDKVILNHISYSFEEGKMYAVLGYIRRERQIGE